MYAIKLTIALSLVYLFYRVLLRKLTFYHCNRWYLLGYSFLSFFIPFINIAPVVEHKNAFTNGIVRYMPVVDAYTFKPVVNPVTSSNNFFLQSGSILLGLFVAGVCLMTARLLLQYRAIRKIKKYARVVKTGDAIIYHVEENIIPFSFGGAIYLNPGRHSEKELEEIILHEYVHVKQKHTVDIFFAELLCILNWYNPFAWMIRHAIRQNLEFIADNDLLQNGVDKKAYQHHLLKVLGTAQYCIANNFNFSSLKKRIVMMNTFKSAKLQMLRFLFILPLLAVLLVAFRDTYKNGLNTKATHYDEAGLIIDAVTNKVLPGVVVKEMQSGLETVTDENGFYKLSVPFQQDPRVSENFRLQKDGYDTSEFQYEYREGNIKGLIHVFGMFNLDDVHKQKVMMFMGADEPFNGNPQYADVLERYKKTVSKNDEFNSLISFIQDHPEVYEFYTTENKKQHIVFLKNGQIEKYGYPGTPSVDNMEQKYGKLPAMMTYDEHGPSVDYLAKWDKISTLARKSFRSSNPDVQIIFPGDSRVIALPKNSKPQVYDMDSNSPKERMAFEKLYGSLAGIVPAASNDPREEDKSIKQYDTIPVKISIRHASATAEKTDDTTILPKTNLQIVRGTDTSNPAIRISPAPNNAIYIVDGVEMPEGWSLEKSNLKAGDVQNVSIGSNDEALKISRGLARNTIICIYTTTAKTPLSSNRVGNDAAMPDTSFGNKKPSPLFFIDGKPVTPKDVSNLAPSKIASIQVIKGEKAVKLFGSKADNGAILIATKRFKGIAGLDEDTSAPNKL